MLIKCTECGKEVSDKADSCPNCGCPIEKSNSDIKENSIENNGITKEKKRKRPIKAIILCCVIMISTIIGGVIYNNNVLQPKRDYESAIKLLSEGKYEEAKNIFESIKDYKDASNLLEQIKYETYIFECIDSFKEVLKNPDSLLIKDIKIYLSEMSDVYTQIYTKTNEEDSKKYPVIVIHSSAQNGFGGNTTGYQLFAYSSDDKKYVYVGNCDTLDSTEIDDDEYLENLICMSINQLIEENVTIDNINLDRIKQIVKDNNS